MAYHHGFAGDDPVSVGELIDRIRREGLPVRLAHWPDRIVSDDYSVGDWPTGELPRITDHTGRVDYGDGSGMVDRPVDVPRLSGTGW